MARQTDFTKLKKDELLKKIGAKLSKDELVRLAQGLSTGQLNSAGILGGAQGSQAQAGQPQAPNAGAVEQGLTGVVGTDD